MLDKLSHHLTIFFIGDFGGRAGLDVSVSLQSENKSINSYVIAIVVAHLPIITIILFTLCTLVTSSLRIQTVNHPSIISFLLLGDSNKVARDRCRSDPFTSVNGGVVPDSISTISGTE